MILPYTQQSALVYKIRKTSGYKTPQRPTHLGVDHAPIIKVNGIQVIAGINGTLRSGYNPSKEGYYTIITGKIAGVTYEYLTCHHSKLLKKSGEVKIGDVIAEFGSTGNSTAMHTHIQLKRNGKIVNPETYITTLATRIEATPLLGCIIRQKATTLSNKIGKLNWRGKTIALRVVKGQAIKGNNSWYELVTGGYIHSSIVKEVI